jgi:hypothetical protein
VPAEQHNYKATRLHFKNLVKRYGKPIVILSLLKVSLSASNEETGGEVGIFFFERLDGYSCS